MPPPPPPLPPPHISYNPHLLEANGQYQEKPESPILIVFLNVVNTSTQLLIGAVVFCAFSLANILDYPFPKSLSQHIYLCVIGYVLLMSQAILSFNPHAGWAYNLKYPEKRMIHGIMQVFGSILAIVGSIIRIVDSTQHFQSAHSITGIIAMVLTFLSLIGGIINYLLSDQKSMNALYKSVHTCIGSLTIIVAFISLCLGFNFLYKIGFGEVNGNLAITLTVFALLGILISGFSRTVLRIVK